MRRNCTFRFFLSEAGDRNKIFWLPLHVDAVGKDIWKIRQKKESEEPDESELEDERDDCMGFFSVRQMMNIR